MSEKQVIMSKKEFDEMEKELGNLRKIVESKSITTIKTPHLSWNGAYTYTDSYFIEYIFGTEESEVVKALKEEIERVRKDRNELSKTASNLEHSNDFLKREKDKWKNLPWYKRLFIK